MKRQALAATLWGAGDLVARQGVQFGATLILARLLSPSDFGVMAMLTVFTGLASVLADAGLSLALIQRQDVDHEDESSVFWFNLCVSAGLALLMCTVSPLIARFFHAPIVAPLAYVMAFTIVANAAGSIHFALLAKRLEFRLQAKAGGISAAISGGVAIVLALAGCGVWALATQAALMAILTTALLWRFNPWRPLLAMRRKSLRKLSSFGFYQLVNSLMEMAYTRLYVLLIGRIFGARLLGYYANADTTRQLPASFLGGLVARVALPLFARANGDVGLYRRGVQLALRMMMLVNAPIVAAMVVLAQPLVVLLFGHKWLAVAPLLQVLALATLFYPMHAINLQALMALGHARLMFRLEVVKKLLGVALLATGLRFGMEGVVWSQVVHSCAALAINAHFTRRWFGYGALSQLLDALPSLASAAFATIAVVLLQRACPVPMPWQVPVFVAVGALAYLGALALVGRGTWHDAKTLLAEFGK